MADRRYLDFELAIEEMSDGGFRARVLESPAGEARSSFTFPLSPLELENALLRLGQQGTRSTRRRLESSEREAARAFGAKLFDAVFADDVGMCLSRSIDEAERTAQGLRIRLRLSDAPSLAGIPWEYLYSTSNDRFLVLSSWTPLVRYLDLPRGLTPLKAEPPLRVLVMISSPSDYPALDTEAEWTRLHDGLGDLVAAGRVELHRLEEASLPALQRALLLREYHTLHFIGHGGFDEASGDGVLMLEGQGGRARIVPGRDLGTILHDHRSLRLAVLNACEGGRTSAVDPFAGSAQSLLRAGIPAVVAMQFEISDHAAIAFAHAFYGAIAVGLPVDASVTEARKAVFGQGDSAEWGTPVVYMRSPDGQIFDLPPAEEAGSAPGATLDPTPVPHSPAEPGEHEPVEPAPPLPVEPLTVELSDPQDLEETAAPPEVGPGLLFDGSTDAEVPEETEVAPPRVDVETDLDSDATSRETADRGSVVDEPTPEREPELEPVIGIAVDEPRRVYTDVGRWLRGHSVAVIGAGVVLSLGGFVGVLNAISPGAAEGEVANPQATATTTAPATPSVTTATVEPTATAEATPTLTEGAPEGSASTPSTAPIVTAHRLVGFVADGDLSEWGGFETHTTTPYQVFTSTQTPWDGTDDVESKWWLGWDDEHLYIAVSVDDDIHHQPSTGNQIYRGDAVDVHVGRDIEGLDRPDDDDFQVILSPGDFAISAPSHVVFQGEGTHFARDRVSDQIDVAAVQKDGGYRLEAAIPWSELGLSGPPLDESEGLPPRLLLSVFDNDGEIETASGSPAQTLVKSHVNGGFQRPQEWGWLILAD